MVFLCNFPYFDILKNECTLLTKKVCMVVDELPTYKISHTNWENRSPHKILNLNLPQQSY